MGESTASLGVEPFLERYPYFPFLLSVTPYEPLQEDSSDADQVELYEEIQKTKAEVLYIFGLGFYYSILLPWLNGEKGRQVVFIEHDLAVIAKGLETAQLDDLFRDERVHLCFSLEKKGLAKEIAERFPSESVAVLGLSSYKKRYKTYFNDLKSSLIRGSILTFAHRQESLHYHRLFRNMLSNFLLLEEAFTPHKMKGCFEKIPAIIVGAGPSLAEAIPTLKNLKDRALLFAGGSSIIALENRGIEPHLAFAIDPNREEYTRLKQHRFMSLPLIFGSRLMPRVFSAFAGPRGYVRTSTGGPFEAWMEGELGLEGKSLLDARDSEALSVTIISVKTALLLGCDPIIFVGMDLAFRKQERYCKGILPSMTLELEKHRLIQRTAEMPIVKKGRKGLYVETAYKWVMESRCLSGIAKAHPDTTFIDATEQGLSIPGVDYTPLDKVSFKNTYPLESMVHAEIGRAGLSLTREGIRKPLLKLKKSLETSAALIDEMIKDPTHPKNIALEIDLKDELAYGLLLGHLEEHLFALSPNESLVRKECREVINAYLRTMAEFHI